ncbi:hypothetical protein ELS43_08875, partial [Shigella flexneri]|nr:hypothetical protein [Shigella flexneri]
NQESRLPPGSDFRRWVWITIAPFVTLVDYLCGIWYQGGVKPVQVLMRNVGTYIPPIPKAKCK